MVTEAKWTRAVDDRIERFIFNGKSQMMQALLILANHKVRIYVQRDDLPSQSMVDQMGDYPLIYPLSFAYLISKASMSAAILNKICDMGSSGHRPHFRLEVVANIIIDSIPTLPPVTILLGHLQNLRENGNITCFKWATKYQNILNKN